MFAPLVHALLGDVMVIFIMTQLMDTQIQETNSFTILVMASFMTLPDEIKNMIHGYSLYRGTVYPHGYARKTGLALLPYHPHHERLEDTNPIGLIVHEVEQEPPNLALLSISRQVREEASAIYLSRNMVVIPSSDLSLVNSLAVDRIDDDLSALVKFLRLANTVAYLKNSQDRSQYP